MKHWSKKQKLTGLFVGLLGLSGVGTSIYHSDFSYQTYVNKYKQERKVYLAQNYMSLKEDGIHVSDEAYLFFKDLIEKSRDDLTIFLYLDQNDSNWLVAFSNYYTQHLELGFPKNDILDELLNRLVKSKFFLYEKKKRYLEKFNSLSYEDFYSQKEALEKDFYQFSDDDFLLLFSEELKQISTMFYDKNIKRIVFNSEKIYEIFEPLDYLILFRAREYYMSKKENDLSQKEKDVRFAYNFYANRISFMERKRILSQFLSNPPTFDTAEKIETGLIRKVRNRYKSVSRTGNNFILDLTQINATLAKEVPRLSIEHNISILLPTLTLLIENNFGNNTNNSSGARGMGQVKPINVDEFMEVDFSNIDIKDQNWILFRTIFVKFSKLGEKYNLDFSYHSQKNILDILIVMSIYHDGPENVTSREGQFLNDDSKQYILEAYNGLTHFSFIYQTYNLETPKHLIQSSEKLNNEEMRLIIK